MNTRTITVESLYSEYAEGIAAAVGLTASEYGVTPDGLASLLRDASGRLSPIDNNRDWLDEAASDLDAIDRLGDGGAKTQDLLRTIDKILYEASGELELY